MTKALRKLGVEDNIFNMIKGIYSKATKELI